MGSLPKNAPAIRSSLSSIYHHDLARSYACRSPGPNMDTYPPLPADIGRIAGPLLIGYLLDWGLFGLLSIQVYLYYLAFTKDPRRCQVLVYGVYVFQMAQTFLLARSAFETFATGFGNINSIDHIRQIWFSVPIMSSIVTLVFQIFMAHRIYQMSRSRVVPAFILLLATTQLAGGIVTGIVGQGAVIFSNFSDGRAFIASGIWNGAGALGDIIIAAYMLYYLTKVGSEWKLVPSRTPLFLRLFFLSGSLVAIIATMNTALCLLPGNPMPTYFQSTSGVLAITYANTFLAMLNARMRIMRGSPSELEDGVHEYKMAAPQETVRSQLVFAPRRVEGDEDELEEAFSAIRDEELEGGLARGSRASDATETGTDR